MENPVAAQYDSWYGQSTALFRDGQPLDLVTQIPAIVARGAVLDVGGGDGRNALYLGERGFTVTVMDISKVGLQKAVAAAQCKHIMIITTLADLSSYQYKQIFSVCLFSFVLHHIDATSAMRALQQAKEHTARGGVHMVATFTQAGGLAARAKRSGRYYPTVAELCAVYQDWSIISLETKVVKTEAKAKTGEPLENEVVFMLVQKV